MNKKIDLLIIGAGPFGLALAVYVKYLGVDHRIVGKPGQFPKMNIPDDRILRSASAWPLDPTDRATIDNYLKSIGKPPADVELFSRDFYLAYCRWFQEQSGVWYLRNQVTKLEQVNGHFEAQLENRTMLEAQHVVIDVSMENGESFIVDEVILATGYKMDLGQIPFLREGNLLEKIWVHDGCPVLDEQFQTTVKGLYIAGSSDQDFDLPFGLTVSVRNSAKIIGSAIVNSQNQPESIIYEF